MHAAQRQPLRQWQRREVQIADADTPGQQACCRVPAFVSGAALAARALDAPSHLSGSVRSMPSDCQAKVQCNDMRVILLSQEQRGQK